MKAVILAAGYGTRLQRDVSSDRSGRFAHLVGVPKPLLPVGRSPLISRWVRALTRSGAVDGIYVVTNALHQAAFAVWAAEFPEVQILSDETRSNEERLGAVACLQLAVKHFGIQDGVIVIGGDTLFREDFSLGRVAQKVSELQARSADSCLLLCYRCRDEGEIIIIIMLQLVEGRTFSCCSAETQKYGILEVDDDLRVLRMKEKPRPSETESRRACPCFYVFSKESLPLLDAFLQEKKVKFNLNDDFQFPDVQILTEKLCVIRTLRSKSATLRGTLCHGSSRGSRFSPRRSLDASTWETCRRTWSVTFTSARSCRTTKPSWFKGPAFNGK
ncbi:uncharacterized protein LOC103460701 isoform X2 [Poecilia reticulata]|uniref:uncharacterized protein LOC103460701 isoform X2 n=1 Tax=Poecilia reticulata TaxID=8081 RepID=UPI0004A39490|nr:PREDICTED: uncharacterized protein LOC103460701 isoform X2 [Poecilia reticulata]